jgi:DAK2 domain fusion protein YloV
MATLERLGPGALRATIITFRDAVRDHAAVINRLNVYPVPDGDTGTNMARTLDAVVEELDQAPDDMTSTCRAISHGSLMGARGNSGVILSQILRGLAAEIERVSEATADTVASALIAAAKSAYKAVLKPVEGTILTVVREAGDAAGRAAAAGGDLAGVLEAARQAGEEALQNSPELLPVLKEAGVVDAGGAGFLLLLDAALYVVTARPLPVPELIDDISLDPLTFEKVAHRGDVSELRYEVMYFCELPDERIDDFKSGWGEIGDSIVVVGGDGTWNCHVHTDDIGAAIEVALDLGGRPSKIRVTDLFGEVDEEHARREAAMQARSHAGAAGLPAVTTAVVAVTVGQGLIELFGQLGVQGLVTGGQTMNPSTAELLDAVEAVNAPQVVLLPNNKNIIPVAEQVDALTTKSVRVVPTRSMPEALAALIVYDPEADVDTNATAMTEVAAAVATGEVTQAVRDSGGPAGPVATGDWIGLAGGEGIVSVAGALLPAAIALLDRLVGDGREIVTVIEGLGSDAGTTRALGEWVEEHRPGVTVEVHRGDQPLYPYLFGVE